MSMAQTWPAEQTTLPLAVAQHGVMAPLVHMPSQQSVKPAGPAFA
jgi:hypothetical protein